MEDKESWLTALMKKDPDGTGEAPQLLATAALVRSALNAMEPPEGVQSAARVKALEAHQRVWSQASQPAAASGSPLSRLGSWLQVAFNLFRRR